MSSLSRRKIREHAFLLLFDLTFSDPEQYEDQIEQYTCLHGAIADDQIVPLSEEDSVQITEKVRGTVAHLAEIDSLLESISEGWKVSRMNRVDLSLMRLAVYEILCERVPKGAAINEAVELAKRYGETRSGSFVNGILARIPDPSA